VVTKTWPASDVRLLASLGVTDVGENRDQEARPKHEVCADLALRWHFIGQLQRNKARHVAGYADVVESVDRPELVDALDHAAAGVDRDLDVLVQVDLDPAAGAAGASRPRGGAAPADLAALADRVASAARLRLRGLMAVAPLDEDPRAAFDRLAGLAQALRREHPEAVVLSAGMSHDLEEAVAAGATHVRVGTAVLGSRAALG
jgi:pyridoxal phosphate enzyme (YggS family)